MDEDGRHKRLSAILIADVAGYTRLIEQDTDGTVAAWQVARAEVIDPAIAEYAGRVVKLTGDGFLAEFPTVLQAVTCAISMQEQFANSPLEFRMGVNLGDIVDDGEDIHGEGVNIAARIEGLAEPGGICISGGVYDQVRNRLEHGFEDMGEHVVKHVSAPVRVYGLQVEIAASRPAQMRSSDLPLPDKPSIAVLPFENMSGDPEQQYFSDGITEDIITDLSKASGLFVIARNSVFIYRGRAVKVQDVSRDLGVRYVLEGSVRKAGERVRITAQLVDGSSGGHLWAERYDRNLTDIFEVQDAVTQQIVAALKVTLSGAEKSLIVGAGTKNVDSHDLFLRGRELIFGLKRDREMFVQSTAFFRRAVEIDPSYAAAYAGLSMAYNLDHQNRWSDAPETSLDQAERFVNTAIAKDDTDPFAHYVASICAMFQKNYQRWAQEADQALSLNPNYAPALSIRGTVHIYTGEPAKAVPFIERAMRLDPAFQQQYVHFLGMAHFVGGDYETAAGLFRDRISINPTTDLSRAFFASALGHLGHLDEAHRVWRELKEINAEYSPAGHIGWLPFRDPAAAEKFTDGLREAGLAEE